MNDVNPFDFSTTLSLLHILMDLFSARNFSRVDLFLQTRILEYFGTLKRFLVSTLHKEIGCSLKFYIEKETKIRKMHRS